MTDFVAREQLARIANLTATPQIATMPADAGPPVVREEIDRSFELPVGLYAATLAGYLGFLAVMSATFMNPELALPMVIFVVSIVGGFGLCAKWVRMKPDTGRRVMLYGKLRHCGIETATGHLDGGAAAVQVLILPALILLWAVCVAIIRAFV